MWQQPVESEIKEHPRKEESSFIGERTKEEPGWPSFGQLVIDLAKLLLEALAGVFLYFVPSRFRSTQAQKSLTPLKDSLKMPEDEAEPPLAQRQTSPSSLSQTRQVHIPSASDKYSEIKTPKMKSSSFKDPSLSSKHRSSKRQEYAEFYGSGEVPPSGRSKSLKERTRHRQREKSSEVVFGAVGSQPPKPVEVKPVDYDNPKFDQYGMRSRYRPDNSY